MSIIQAMFAGSSALATFGEAMTVIGNNLSNANTTAFKASSSSFEDILIQTVGSSGSGASTQIGTGVGLADVRQNMSQGTSLPTANVFDMSINGNGFFSVRDTTVDPSAINEQTGARENIFYTRAGGFRKNLDDNLVNSSGHVLQGWELDADGVKTPDGVVDINFGAHETRIPTPTTLIDLSVNLDADQEIVDSVVHPYNANDALSYTHEAPIQVFDSLGRSHSLSVQFVKTAENMWDWHVTADSVDLDPTQAGPENRTAMPQPDAPAGVAYTSGVLEFSRSGRLNLEGSVPIRFNFRDANPQDILFNFGDAIGENVDGTPVVGSADSTNDFQRLNSSEFTYLPPSGGVADTGNTGLRGSRQNSGEFSLTSSAQNGFPSGALDTFSVNNQGIISGSYTNGETQSLYQIALNDFPDEEALRQVGANLFSETVASGLALANDAETGRLGSIVSFSLEQSNVDMSSEFVRMITTQRGFQANSRMVTVTDGMLEELLALKR